MTCECGRRLVSGEDVCWKCSGDSFVPPWWRPTMPLTPPDFSQGYYVDLEGETLHVLVIEGFIKFASCRPHIRYVDWDWIA